MLKEKSNSDTGQLQHVRVVVVLEADFALQQFQVELKKHVQSSHRAAPSACCSAELSHKAPPAAPPPAVPPDRENESLYTPLPQWQSLKYEGIKRNKYVSIAWTWMLFPELPQS